jgi:hypothetical protein
VKLFSEQILLSPAARRFPELARFGREESKMHSGRNKRMFKNEDEFHKASRLNCKKS